MSLPRLDPFTGTVLTLDGLGYAPQEQRAAQLQRDGAGRCTQTATDATYECHYVDALNTYGAAQYSQGVAVALASFAAYVAVTVRASGIIPSQNYYEFITDGSPGASHTSINKCVGGVITSLATLATTIVPGDLIRLEAVLDSLTARVNGTVVWTGTDPDLPTGVAGLGGYWGSGPTWALDDWEGGELASGGSLVTGTVAATVRRATCAATGTVGAVVAPPGRPPVSVTQVARRRPVTRLRPGPLSIMAIGIAPVGVITGTVAVTGRRATCVASGAVLVRGAIASAVRRPTCAATGLLLAPNAIAGTITATMRRSTCAAAVNVVGTSVLTVVPRSPTGVRFAASRTGVRFT